MPVSLEQKGVLNLIRLQGAIDIGGAQELKELLIQGLTNDSKVLVKLADVTDLDVTAVELLWAARCEAKASSVEFSSLKGRSPESVSLVLAEAGLAQFAVKELVMPNRAEWTIVEYGECRPVQAELS